MSVSWLTERTSFKYNNNRLASFGSNLAMYLELNLDVILHVTLKDFFKKR